MKFNTFCILAAASIMAACGSSDDAGDAIDEVVWETPTRYIGSGMPEAFDAAKASLDGFFDVLANPPEGSSEFKVLVKKPASEPQYRFNLVWVGDIQPVEDSFVGRITEHASDIAKSERDGRTIAFTRDEIYDWGFVGPNGIYGQFVLRRELEKQEERGVEVSALKARFKDLSELPSSQ